jgi:mRNA interferase MazF
MVVPATGTVILVPFPFSDLSHAKLRPAVILADAGRGDWVLCQITSSPYADPYAVVLESQDFARGALKFTSYARPGKLFTANDQLMTAEVGVLKKAVLEQLVQAVVGILQAGL